MRRAPLPALLLGLALAACKSAAPPPEKTRPFACPVRDAAVTYDNGRSLTFQGADPADASVCLARPAEGAPVRLIWGLIEDAPNEGRGHRDGMIGLFPTRAASRANYTATVVSAGSGVQYPYATTWRIIGFEAVTVPAGRFETVVYERGWRGTGTNQQALTIRYWVTLDSQILVKRTVEATQGTTLLRDFAATRVTVPPPPPPPPARAEPPRS